MGHFDDGFFYPQLPVHFFELCQQTTLPALAVLLLGYSESASITSKYSVGFNSMAASGNRELVAFGQLNIQ